MVGKTGLFSHSRTPTHRDPGQVPVGKPGGRLPPEGKDAMNRSFELCRIRRCPTRSPGGFTLIEVLIATALTLLLMGAVVQIFGAIGSTVSDSRSTLELTDRLRTTEVRLQMDLEGITAIMLPPRSPETCEGYFECIEGPSRNPSALAVNNDPGATFPQDATVGDVDDVLMFTTLSKGQPFVGLCKGQPVESHIAEVAWFVRGRTLYRRVLLVAPGAPIVNQPGGFFAQNDISVHVNPAGNLVANALSDLTQRECRFAHHPTEFPFDVRGWGQLGLPTLRECSSAQYMAGREPPTTLSATAIDYWSNKPYPDGVDQETGTLGTYADGTRMAEDVILTNVIGFDVKLWDPGSGQYVDLGANNAILLSGPGDQRSQLHGGNARVYCTWSTHYEHDGIDQDGDDLTDEAHNGFDDPDTLTGSLMGGADDVGERETAPPYPVPLRGIQVKIRVFEPDSRQIREVTVVQDFLPK